MCLPSPLQFGSDDLSVGEGRQGTKRDCHICCRGGRRILSLTLGCVRSLSRTSSPNRPPTGSTDVPGVGSGQVAVGGGGRELEAGRQLLEAPRRQLTGACGELQQSSHLVHREVADGSPEPVQHSAELWARAVDYMVGTEVRHTVLARSTQ